MQIVQDTFSGMTRAASLNPEADFVPFLVSDLVKKITNM